MNLLQASSIKVTNSEQERVTITDQSDPRFPLYLMYPLNAGAGVTWRVGPKDLEFDRPLDLVKRQ
jgi:hypothetical protein